MTYISDMHCIFLANFGTLMQNISILYDICISSITNLGTTGHVFQTRKSIIFSDLSLNLGAAVCEESNEP